MIDGDGIKANKGNIVSNCISMVVLLIVLERLKDLLQDMSIWI